MFDTTSSSGILAEACLIQFPFWFIVVLNTRTWILNTFSEKDWFKAIAKQKGGTSEWIAFATALPQHTFAAFFLILADCTGNTSWFVHGIISEWAYETIDIVNQTQLYYAGKFDDNEDGAKTYIAMLCHHIPGVVTILPATIFFQDVPEFRAVVWSLLGYAWVMVVGYLLGRTYDLKDLAQRTRYTIVFVVNFSVAFYSRMYSFPIAMFILANAYATKVSRVFVGLGVMYAVLMTGFNFIVIAVNLERLWKLCYAKKDEEKVAAGLVLQRRTSNFMKCSLDCLDDEDDEDGGRRVTRKMVRAKTEPIFEYKRQD